MSHPKHFGCIRIWHAFAKQTYPEQQILYRRSYVHHPTDCHHKSEAASQQERGSPPLQQKQQKPGRVLISYIHFLGTTKRTQADEFIEIKNLGASAQDLSGWRISAADPGQGFVFPDGAWLGAGATFRVYTNREPREKGHFSFGSKRAIWNDHGDLGQLFDRSGALVAKYGYGSDETRTIDSIKEANEVSGLQIVYDPAQLVEHGKPAGKVDFLTALERALRCILEEAETGEQATEPASRQELIEQLNQRSLHLLHGADLPDPADAKKSWIFGLADGRGGSYRVVVDRSGAEPAFKTPFRSYLEVAPA